MRDNRPIYGPIFPLVSGDELAKEIQKSLARRDKFLREWEERIEEGRNASY